MIKINTGFNKKVPGTQEYSSEGVHVTLEMELPDAYLSNKQALQEQIQNLVSEARDQVENQLSDNSTPLPFEPTPPSNGQFQAAAPTRPASNKQLNYLLSLAKRAQNMGPQDICNQFQVSDLTELSSKQASGLIEKLKTGEAA